MPRKKTKKEHQRSLLSERQLILRNLDKYNYLIKVGFTRKQAVKKLIKGTKLDSLSKLQHRVGVAVHTVGVTGVSLSGIRLTDVVKKYIKELTTDNIIFVYKKGQQSLRLIKPKVWVK